jgi:hypothetical protein
MRLPTLASDAEIFILMILENDDESLRPGAVGNNRIV